MSSDQVLLEEFILNHGTEAARIVEQLKMDQLIPLFNSLQVELTVVLLLEMDVYSAYRCLEETEEEKTARILENLPATIASLILRRMNDDKKERILNRLETNTAALLKQMLYHLPGSAGAQMDPQVPVLTEEINVKDAFDRVKKSKQQSYEYIYIINQERKFTGIVKLEELVIADTKEKMISLVNKDIPRLYSEVEINKIIDHPGWEEYNALPVVDREDIFLGTLYYSVIKKTGKEKTKGFPKHAIMAGNALGELYRIGLSGLIFSTLRDKEIKSNKSVKENE